MSVAAHACGFSHEATPVDSEAKTPPAGSRVSARMPVNGPGLVYRTRRYRTQVAGHQPTIASTRRARQWSGETSAKPRPLRARRPKLKPSQPYVGGGIDCQILTSAPAAWSEPARPSARRCSAQAAHRLVSVSSLASGSTERAHRRHFQVITATTLRRIQRPRPDRSEVAAPF